MAYENIVGANVIVQVANEFDRLALVAYDNMVVHQLDTDSIYIFNLDNGLWELSGGPQSVVQLGLNANGLTLNGNILSLDLADATSAGAMSSSDFVKLSTLANKNFISEVFTLTPLNISQGRVTLSDTPADPEGLTFHPDGGIQQRYGVDFTIVGNDLIWSGMGLDGFLEANDVIRVAY